MTHPENTSRSRTADTHWRDVPGLTAEQIAELENEAKDPCPFLGGGDDWLLAKARHHQADNLLAAAFIGDIPRPPDARNVLRWQDNGDGRWYREFAGTSREAEGEPRPCECDGNEMGTVAGTVGIAGVQFSDGTVHRWVEHVWLRGEAGPEDVRALAAALTEAADELDRIAGVDNSPVNHD